MWQAKYCLELQKPLTEPQGYQRYRTSGRVIIANQMKKEKKQRRSTSMSMITTPQELHR